MGRAFTNAVCAGSLLLACGGESARESIEFEESALVQNGVDVILKVTSDWGGGYCADVTLKNLSSAPVTDWRVSIALNGSTLSNAWNATTTVSGSTLTAAPLSYNQNIPVGGTSAFGFCATSANATQRATVQSATITGGGGSATGGSSSGGSSSTGGVATGGVSTGGVATGGVATGGVSTGGVATGGVSTGGVSTGGVATGGVSTGGVSTGGVSTGGVSTGGVATGGVSTGGVATGGTSTGGSSTGGSGGSTQCSSGTTGTSFATSCPTAPYRTCTAGTWTAPPRSNGTVEQGMTLRYETTHFAFFWKDGTNITLAQAQSAGSTLEMIWNTYFGSPMYFPETYCSATTKYKAGIHIDNTYPLLGGSYNSGSATRVPGMWVGPGAASDHWGLAHEFMHGVQSHHGGLVSQGQNYIGWIFESHANFAPHQLSEYGNNVHCSEMLANAPHLYLGSTRDRYCNWQFMEYLKDKECHKAVNDIWTTSPASNDPFSAIMKSRNWTISQMNDFFGDWAMHNITWDYKTSGPGFRSSYGGITDVSRPERRNRLTRVEPLDTAWATNRRFRSPYYQAPQRYGYNVVRLFPEAGKTSVTVKFRGVIQSGANSDFRWGLVATNSGLTSARYSALQKGTDGEVTFCLGSGESLFLVVTATPSVQQQIYWDQPYASIYRYPYTFEVNGAWPEGYQNGALDACPSGTVRHGNGGGCAVSNLASTVFVGPNARVLGGNVSGNARIEDNATILSGATVSGGTVGGLSVLNRFSVSGSATVRTTFYPPGFFEAGQGLSGSATLFGDVEYRGANLNRNSGAFSGFVDSATSSMSAAEVTVAPPYAWRN